MLQHIKDKIITVDTDDVLKDAREEGLDVNSIQDFRHMAPHYHRIEALMDEYRSPFINSRVLSGLTTGLGGFVSSLTFATIDTISLSLQLYWLSQCFSIVYC